MNYKSDFHNICSGLSFELSSMLKIDVEKGDFLAVGKIKGQKVIIKAILKSDQSKVSKIKVQFVVDEILAEVNKTKMITSGEAGRLFFGVREFIEAEVLNQYEKKRDQTLFGYDDIDEAYVKEQWIQDAIFVELEKIRSVSCKRAEDVLKQESLTQSRFAVNIGKEVLYVHEKLDVPGIEHPLKYYLANRKNLLNAERRAVIMGDLTPANILIDGKKLYITDFEWFGVDNKMFDIAFFWLFLWRHPFWQKNLIQHYVKTPEDEEDFRLNILRLGLGCLWWKRFKRFSEKEKKLHPWVQYCLAAGRSFESLTSMKT